MDDGGIVTMIRIIYKDKNVGRVNESHLDELLKSDRVAAFCRPNDKWVGVKQEQTGVDVGFHGDSWKLWTMTADIAE